MLPRSAADARPQFALHRRVGHDASVPVEVPYRLLLCITMGAASGWQVVGRNSLGTMKSARSGLNVSTTHS